MKEEDQRLHEKFVFCGEKVKEWTRKCVLMLPEIDRLRIWEEKGFGSIYEYAAKLAGMSRNMVNEALRIMEKIGDKLELQEVVREKGMWAVKPVIGIATEETAKFWAAKVREMPQKTLSTFVANLAHRGAAAIDTVANCDKIILLLDLSPELAREMKKLKGNDWDDTIREFLRLRENELINEKPSIVKTKSHSIPVAINCYVLKRSNSRCEFLLCKREYRELHHADRFSLVHKHDPDRIFALCHEHHDLAHRGLIGNENLDVRYWKIQEEPEKYNINNVIDQRVLEFKL